jgi:hypothetical protein
MSISYECGEANVVKHRSRILFRRYFENTASVAVATRVPKYFSTAKDFAPLPPSQLLYRHWSMRQRNAENATAADDRSYCGTPNSRRCLPAPTK